jgi:hypothetical protein
MYSDSGRAETRVQRYTLSMTVFRPDFRISITVETLCLCDVQQYSQQDAQIEPIIVHFQNLQRQRIPRIYNTYTIATTQYYPSNTTKSSCKNAK